MDVTPRYLGAGSFLARRDPRVLLLVPVLYFVAVTKVADLRGMLGCAVAALVYYRAAGIPWREVRANWILMLVFTTLLVTVNSVFTAADTRSGAGETLFTVPLAGTEVTWATLSYALTLLVRYVSLAMVSFPVAFAIAPADLGVALARLRLSQRLAYGVDLTFRFLPSTVAAMRETVDAQRVRGYEHSRSHNPIRKLASLKPVVVPVTVNALIDAEDTANAMDLRGFGAKHRTWMRELGFERTDYLVMGAFLALAAAMTAAKFFGPFSEVWTP